MGFRVVVRRLESASLEVWQFDFVAVCNGVFSEPRLPEVENRARFTGRVVHSSELSDENLLEGKRVIVVGAGKSALDCEGHVGGRLSPSHRDWNARDRLSQFATPPRRAARAQFLMDHIARGLGCKLS